MSQYSLEIQKMMRMAAADPSSWINEGLEELSEMFKYRWVIEDSGYPSLAFVHRNTCTLENICDRGDCECQVDHRCRGCECGSCLCSMNECECDVMHFPLSSEYGDGEQKPVIFAGILTYEFNRLTQGTFSFIKGHSYSVHPHIDGSGGVCWGDSEDPQSVMPRDHFLRVLGWISQHSQPDQYASGMQKTIEYEIEEEDTDERILDLITQESPNPNRTIPISPFEPIQF